MRFGVAMAAKPSKPSPAITTHCNGFLIVFGHCAKVVIAGSPDVRGTAWHKELASTIRSACLDKENGGHRGRRLAGVIRVGEKSDIEVFHIQRILFDELTACLDIFAHERCEDGFALGDVLK